MKEYKRGPLFGRVSIGANYVSSYLLPIVNDPNVARL